MNSQNPYDTPDSSIIDRDRPWERDVPDEILSPIKHGWIAAAISGVFTLAATIFSMLSPFGDALGAWGLVDVVLIAVLAFGIWRRSRTAATFMFVYFLISKILVMVLTGMPTGAVIGLVFLIFYFRAMTATYRYHRFVKDWKRNPVVPRKSLSEDPFFASRDPGASTP